MSWTDEEIDRIFQKEATKQPVEYKDAYWREFEAMLPVSRKRDFLWFLTSGIFIALLLITPFLGVLNAGRSAEVMAMENSQRDTRQIAEQNEEIINRINAAQIDSNNAPRNEQKEELNDSPVIPVNSVVVNSISQDVVDNDVSEVNDGVRVGSVMGEREGDLSIEERAKQNPVVDSKEGKIENLTSIAYSESMNEASAANKLNGTESEVDYGTRVSESIPIQGEVSTLDITALKQVDQNRLSSELNSISYDLSLPVKTLFYVEGNAGLSQSLITPSDDFSYSFGAGVGAQFRKGRVLFTTGVNGIWAHHKDIHLNRQAKVYGFGSTVVQSHLNYSELYTLEANLNVGYQLGRHNINVGVRPSFVVGSKVKFTQSEVSTNDNRTVYGFMDGINRWGLKPSLGYGYNLNHNLAFGFNVSTQLLNSVNEEFINGFNNILPIDGQIYIRKTIRLRK